MGLISFLKSAAHKTYEISSISNVLGNQKPPKNLAEPMDEKRLSERALAYENLYTLWEKHELLKHCITVVLFYILDQLDGSNLALHYKLSILRVTHKCR